MDKNAHKKKLENKLKELENRIRYKGAIRQPNYKFEGHIPTPKTEKYYKFADWT